MRDGVVIAGLCLMRLDIHRLKEHYDAARSAGGSSSGDGLRGSPSRLRYDYLVLHHLARDIEALIDAIPVRDASPRALDLGCGESPYSRVLEKRGFSVRTLDTTREKGADYEGTAEATGLEDASFDLVLCTQVLEHCERPWLAASEITRVLKPGGALLVSVPHLWFYHPHPGDYWRFTQEGVVALCRSAGLEPTELRAQGGAILALAQIVNFLLYGFLGKLGAPLYALLNSLAPPFDRALKKDLFCLNFACLARKP
jgi:2-polyprenyl-3-methyl-5-hydroxy-6-metoxy-1,4-benzoquinol methylase